jgi:hypothetical protein
MRSPTHRTSVAPVVVDPAPQARPWRIRAKLAVLAVLAGVGAASSAGWKVLVVALACLAIPVTVAIRAGPGAARALFPFRTGHPAALPKEMSCHVRNQSRRSAANTR